MDSSIVKKVLLAAEAKANEIGVAVSIAVVDNHGALLGFFRMDGAIAISPQFAQTKAYTSGTLGLATSDIAAYAIEGKPYFGITSLFAGNLTVIAGGLPIKVDGKLVGGIGVGGSTDVSQDEEVAKAGLSVL